jgi:hypothetical protein
VKTVPKSSYVDHGLGGRQPWFDQTNILRKGFIFIGAGREALGRDVNGGLSKPIFI